MSDLVGPSEDRFSRVAAHMIFKRLVCPTYARVAVQNFCFPPRAPQTGESGIQTLAHALSVLCSLRTVRHRALGKFSPVSPCTIQTILNTVMWGHFIYNKIMSHRMGKPTICMGESKGADQLKLISAFVFATRIF